MELKEKIKSFPGECGVYIFKDHGGQVLYVGKAKHLKHRVRSYFSGNRGFKEFALSRFAADIDYVITATEVEALLLESNLIKKYRPKFNVRLKDDKEYPYIRLDLGEEYPRLEMVRKVKRDKAKYFGPYPGAGVIHDTLELARKLFPLRSCSDWRGKARPCLNFHIKRCLAPCADKVSPQDYREMLDRVIMFLEGKHRELMADLRRRMEEAAAELEFERAADLRDQLGALEKLSAAQRIITNVQWNLDVVAAMEWEARMGAQLLLVRGGKVLGNEHFRFEYQEGVEPGEMVGTFIREHYARATLIPREILVSHLPEDHETLQHWLRDRRQGLVVIRVPQRGEKKMLLDMARSNLEVKLKTGVTEGQEQAGSRLLLSRLAEALELRQPPRRIECYDISHFQGAQTVASMVVFEEGRAARDQYRRFRIRDLQGPDDFASMEQVIRRRFSAALEGKDKFSRLPDLVVIDGGKGQLSSAVAVIRELGMDLDVVSLAKREEEIFLPNQSLPVILDRDNPGLKLLQQVRDEAHRFAVTYHRKLRNKETLVSALDSIPGVGPARRTALLKAFGSLEQLREKEVGEIAAVPGIPWSVAEEIHKLFHRKK